MVSLYLGRLTVQSVLYALRWKQKLDVFCAKLHVYIYAYIYKITYMYVCIVYLFFLFLGDSFSQFRFAEEKEWDGETSCPKQVREMF